MKRLLAAFLLIVSLHSIAANTRGTDATDLWWNANESGWGVNVNHQDDTMFLTFFVYGTNNQATWSSATLTASGSGPYIGPLYRTSGPWLGTVFNPSTVGVTQVGTANFNLDFIESATLSYVVDGINVVKKLTRQPIKYNLLGGSYTGALRQVQSGCAIAANNGTFVGPATVSISHFNSFLSMTIITNGDRCDYTGLYAQDGKMGRTTGTNRYSCTSGISGTFQVFEVEGAISGILGRFSASNNVCTTVTGRFGIVRN